MAQGSPNSPSSPKSPRDIQASQISPSTVPERTSHNPSAEHAINWESDILRSYTDHSNPSTSDLVQPHVLHPNHSTRQPDQPSTRHPGSSQDPSKSSSQALNSSTHTQPRHPSRRRMVNLQLDLHPTSSSSPISTSSSSSFHDLQPNRKISLAKSIESLQDLKSAMSAPTGTGVKDQYDRTPIESFARNDPRPDREERIGASIPSPYQVTKSVPLESLATGHPVEINSLNPPPPAPIGSSSVLSPTAHSSSSYPHHSHSSVHSHHSPSTIAQSILRTASSSLSSKDLEAFDMEQVAAQNDYTAEALRKLDGLSNMSGSPRVTRGSHHSSSSIHSHSRPTSTGPRRRSHSRPNTPSGANVKDRSGLKDRSKPDDLTSTSPKKTQTRSITSTVRDFRLNPSPHHTDDALTHPDGPTSPSIQVASPRSSSKPVTSSSLPTHHLQHVLVSPAATSSSLPAPRSSPISTSPRQVFHPLGSCTRRASHTKSLTLTELDSTIPSPKTTAGASNLVFTQTVRKRGSSSSTSCTGGTTVTIESRESTLPTSVPASSSSFPSYQHPPRTVLLSRSSPTKGRSSVSSDSSSTLSHTGLVAEPGRHLERSNSHPIDTAEHGIIPPVPPLPKDYETFKAHQPGVYPQSRHPSHSSAQIIHLKPIGHPTDPTSASNTAPVSEQSSQEHEPLSPPVLVGPHALQPSTPSSASATSRFLHSLTSHKTLDDTSGLAASLQSPARTSPTHSFKPPKKWSLSAALGMNKTASSSKDSTPDDFGCQSLISPSCSHHQLVRSETKELSGILRRDAPHTGGGGESNSILRAGLGHAKRASWLGTPFPSSSTPAPESPHLATSPGISIESGLQSIHQDDLTRDRTQSNNSVLTSETTTINGFSAIANSKSSVGSALSSRRTPSGIPFFSRKASGNQSLSLSDKSVTNLSESSHSHESSSTTAPKVKSAKSSEKSEGEAGGRKSMMSLNVFIRNSVHRRPTLSNSKLSPSSLPLGSSSSDLSLSSKSISSRHSLKPTNAKPSPVRESHHQPTTPKKLAINLLHSQAPETSDSFVGQPSSAKKITLSSKASNLIGRRRGKTISVSGSPKEKELLPPPLPPLQMSAIHPSMSERVASISSEKTSISLSSASKRRSIEYSTSSSLSARGTRVRSLKESTTSLRKPLPTIDASPLRVDDELEDDGARSITQQATHARREVSKENINATDSVESTALSPNPYQSQPDPSPSLTPTKIPRAVFRPQKNSASPLLKSQTSDYYLVSKADSMASPRANELVDSSSESQDMTHDFALVGSQHQTIGKRTSEGFGSLIPRSRSGASTSAKMSQKLSNNDLRDGSNESSSRSQATDGEMTTGSPEKLQEINVKPSQESSAAARLAAARRTVAKSQEVQAARVASRRLSTHASHVDQSTVSEFGINTASGTSSTRSSRTITSKLTIPSRMSRSSTTPSLISASEAVGHTSRSSPSAHGPRSRTTESKDVTKPIISEEEAKGDEEMAQYVARQRTKKLMSGMTPAEVSKLFEFPKPVERTKPMTTQESLRLYKNYLSDYEKGEILAYDKIYYVGSESAKKMASENKPAHNFGYDDDRGDYQIVKHDHLVFRYEIMDVLGKGSFGQVLQCRDHKTGEMVAIKIIRNKRRFHHQALVEIRVLENLLDWDPEDKHCVLKMTDHFTFRGHLCIVNELLSINLYELIRNNSFNGFSTTLIRRFTIQILTSLSLLRHHRVVHCDLKPENILLKHPEKSAIKTIDFGSSCFENEKVYTYIQSRFYRSPEVILGMNYHMAIDMWSLGCILAELYTGYPIFPGETESEQLACIMEVLGMPDKYLVDRSSRRKLFFDSTGAPRPVVNSKGRRRRVGSKTLQSVLKTDDDLFVDFIAKCLAWDPERRLKPDPAMRHPWILAGRSRPVMTSSISNLHNHHSLTNATSHSTGNSSSSGGGGRLTSGRFNSGSTSLHISSPRRKQAGSTTINHHSSSTTTSSTTTTTTGGSGTAGLGSVNLTTSLSGVGGGAGRSSVSYRLRTQSGATRQTFKNPGGSSGNSHHVGGSSANHGSNSNSNGKTNNSVIRQSLPVRAGH